MRGYNHILTAWRRYSGYLVLALLFVPGFLQADTVVLRNGRSLNGTVLDQSRTHIRFRSGRRVRSIRKKTILRISYGSLPKIAPTTARRRQPRKVFRRVVRPVKKPEKKKPVRRSPLPAEKKASPPPRRVLETGGPERALFQSAFLPGRGQWLAGRRNAALVAGIGTITLFTGSLFALNRFRNAGASATRESRLLLGYATARGDSNAALAAAFRLGDANSNRLREAQRLRVPSLGMFLFYAWNLADAYFFHPTRTTRRLTSETNNSDKHTLAPGYFRTEPIHMQWSWESRF